MTQKMFRSINLLNKNVCFGIFNVGKRINITQFPYNMFHDL